ncbi:hypothetical protein, partial [Clostridioides difficile]|uniref:hypothetical protein n=1 Tax=Clostridioides difficile TaxID=1496 RepID=UPI00163DAFC0
ISDISAKDSETGKYKFTIKYTDVSGKATELTVESTNEKDLKEPIAFATATEVVCLSSPASLSIFLVTDSNCFLAVFDTADS